MFAKLRFVSVEAACSLNLVTPAGGWIACFRGDATPDCGGAAKAVRSQAEPGNE